MPRKTTTLDSTLPDKPRSLFKETWFITLITFFAVLLMLYPVVATQWNNYRQQQVSDAYSNKVDDLEDNHEAQQIVAKAKEYNQRNTAGPIIDPWSARVAKDNKVYQEYLAELSTFEEMSQVVVPSINVSLPVYHGTEDDVLTKGLGHLFGTALPVGGENTHAVVTGHTGMPDATMFDNLINVKKGDAIYVNTYGEKMKYEVTSIEVVLPEETDSLSAVKGQDLFTLITCTPYGVNSHRLLVHAHRVPMDDQEDEQVVKKVSFFNLQWWMIMFIGISMLALFLLAIWIAHMDKKIRTVNKKIARRKSRKSSR